MKVVVILGCRWKLKRKNNGYKKCFIKFKEEMFMKKKGAVLSLVREG